MTNTIDITSNGAEPADEVVGTDDTPVSADPQGGEESTPRPPRKRRRRRTARRPLTATERQAAARRAYGDDPTLTAVDLGAMFDRSPRWGRDRIAEARAIAAGVDLAELPRPEPDEDDPGPVTALDDHRIKRIERIIAVAIGIVAVAPMVLSFVSLADYGGDALGLAGHLRFVFPVAVDAVALACVALTFHAVLSGDGSAGPRMMLWAVVAGSAVLNHRHGETVSADAGVVFAAMPIVGAVLLDLWLRRLRRGVLRSLGVVEDPLARYRLARWLVAPRETAGAWRTSVRENVSSPVDALAAYRASRGDQ